MEWGRLIGVTASIGGAVGTLMKTAQLEWKSSSYLEGTATRRIIQRPNPIIYSVRINNRRDVPLIIEGYAPIQRMRVGNLLLNPLGPRAPLAEIEHHLRGTEIRIDPHLPGSNEWPFAVIKGEVEAESPFATALIVVILAKHQRLWRKRDSMAIEIAIKPE